MTRLTQKFNEARTHANVAFRLIVLSNFEQRILDLGEQPIVIGRGKKADLRLADNLVSREHAKILCSGHGYKIQDLDSHNGTIVNGVTVAEKELQHWDIVSLGRTRLIFVGGKVDPNNLPSLCHLPGGLDLTNTRSKSKAFDAINIVEAVLAQMLGEERGRDLLSSLRNCDREGFAAELQQQLARDQVSANAVSSNMTGVLAAQKILGLQSSATQFVSCDSNEGSLWAHVGEVIGDSPASILAASCLWHLARFTGQAENEKNRNLVGYLSSVLKSGDFGDVFAGAGLSFVELLSLGPVTRFLVQSSEYMVVLRLRDSLVSVVEKEEGEFRRDDCIISLSGLLYCDDSIVSDLSRALRQATRSAPESAEQGLLKVESAVEQWFDSMTPKRTVQYLALYKT